MNIRNVNSGHRSVVKMVGHALTLENDYGVWHGLSVLIEARLTAFERGCLSAAALAATDDAQFWPIIEAAVPARLAGQPLPPFLDLDAEARWWAGLASPTELRSWLTACFVRLPESEQVGFLAAAKRRAVA